MSTFFQPAYRVNYPLKRVLIEMMDAGSVNLDDSLHNIFVYLALQER